MWNIPLSNESQNGGAKISLKWRLHTRKTSNTAPRPTLRDSNNWDGEGTANMIDSVVNYHQATCSSICGVSSMEQKLESVTKNHLQWCMPVASTLFNGWLLQVCNGGIGYQIKKDVLTHCEPGWNVKASLSNRHSLL